MGTKIYSQIFIEFIVSKMNVKTINYMSGNYVINLLHYVWRADKKDIILAINNVPPISLNRNTMLLLHNIFYLFSRKELFQNIRYTGLVFVFKYVYFWTIMTLFPPKEIYVQSQLMFERVPEKLKSRVTILNKKIYLDYLHKNETNFNSSQDQNIDILITGGIEKHKNNHEIISLLDNFISRPTKIHCSERLKLQFRNENISFSDLIPNSHSEYVALLRASKNIIVGTLFDSFNMNIQECEMLRSTYFVQKSEASDEFATNGVIFSNMFELEEKLRARDVI